MKMSNERTKPSRPAALVARTLPSVGFVCVLGVHLLAAGVAAQSPPTFTSVQARTNGEVVLRFSGATGQRYDLEAAPDLATWETLATLAGAATVEHVDSAAPGFASRFYRTRQLDDPTTLSGDHLSTTNGTVIIHPVFHASLLLKWDELVVYVDPAPVNGSISPYASLPKADVILVTHGHGDHFDAGAIGAVRKTNAVILAPSAVYSSMSTTLRAATTVLTNGVSTNLLGLSVQAVPAYNNNHPRGAGNAYVVSLAGRRLFFTGDTGDTPEMRGLSSIDVAFVCMNVPFTMTVAQAAAAVREFRPAVVYPYHYRNQDGSFADLEAFKRQVHDLGIEVRLRKWY